MRYLQKTVCSFKLLIISAIVFVLSTVAAQAEFYHPYDTDQDCIIGDFELLNAIDDWAVGTLGDFELLDLIDYWAAGNYCEVDNDGDGYTVGEGDCNDGDALINPGASEVCGNVVDENCDGSVDEGCSSNIPAPPTGLSANAGNGRVEINWDIVNNAATYNLYYSISEDLTSNNGIIITGITSPYMLKNLTNGATYYFVVTSVNGDGIESTESEMVSASPVEVPSWGALEPIRSDTEDALFDTLIDSRGNVTVFWTSINGTAVEFWNRRFIVGTGWTLPEKIDSLESEESLPFPTYYNHREIGPKYIMDQMGNITMVWESKNVSSRLWAKRYTKNGGWEDKEQLHEMICGTTACYLGLRLFQDSYGNITASSMGGIFNYKIGSGWSKGSFCGWSSVGSEQELPYFADDFGNIIVPLVSYYTANIHYNILSVCRYSINSDTSQGEVIHRGFPDKLYDIHLVGDSAGNATILWRETDGSNNSWGNHYTVGIGWGTAEVINDNQAGEFRRKTTQVVVDQMGNVTALWIQVDGNYNLWANRYIVGTGWGKAELMENSIYDVMDQKLAVDAQGNVTVAWRQYNGKYNRTWARRYTLKSGWETALELPGAPEHPKEVIVDSLGNVTVITWNDNLGSFHSSRYNNGSGWSPAVWVVPGGFPYGADIQAVLDDANNITLIMHDLTSLTNPKIYGNKISSARYTEKTGWGTWQGISLLASEDSSPKVMIDNIGNVTVVWEEKIYVNFIRAIRLAYQ